MKKVYLIMAQSKSNTAIKDVIAAFNNEEAAQEKVDLLNDVPYSHYYMNFYVDPLPVLSGE